MIACIENVQVHKVYYMLLHFCLQTYQFSCASEMVQIGENEYSHASLKIMASLLTGFELMGDPYPVKMCNLFPNR